MGLRNMRNKKKLFIEKLEQCLGIVSLAAKATGISRRVVYYWIEKDEAFKKECMLIEERNLDIVENKLLEKIMGIKNENGHYIEKPDTACIIFYLKTKGKHRGYIEKSEISNDHNFNFTFKDRIIDQNS